MTTETMMTEHACVGHECMISAVHLNHDMKTIFAQLHATYEVCTNHSNKVIRLKLSRQLQAYNIGISTLPVTTQG